MLSRNHGVFYLFLFNTISACITLFIQCIIIFVNHTHSDGIDMLPSHIILTVASALFILCTVSFYPLLRLFILHTYNFLAEKTSSERFSRSNTRSVGPTNLSLMNFYRMCCNK